MSVVYRPGKRAHKTERDCNPGWRVEGTHAIPPSAYDLSAGTVWECDECGLTWVCTGPVAANAPGVPGWRREGRIARRRRERNETARGPAASGGPR